ncbi:hypothetical protein BDY17DRAFT_177720 [Neohortaea acidophila]|uniref:Uncharacterized protein n=1 Tax=Neohortaea acidophila TaxID=245834 RepID=A0A6A6PQZ8_9PEZI|nr:uncharacterized protein BDY17DRAFT_177720 [Neohortaea acidophila]KAF2482121.1 hypothetical protein BDY17DRAFT_177720 [Neohortaea acidophila]
MEKSAVFCEGDVHIIDLASDFGSIFSLSSDQAVTDIKGDDASHLSGWQTPQSQTTESHKVGTDDSPLPQPLSPSADDAKTAKYRFFRDIKFFRMGKTRKESNSGDKQLSSPPATPTAAALPEITRPRTARLNKSKSSPYLLKKFGQSQPDLTFTGSPMRSLPVRSRSGTDAVWKGEVSMPPPVPPLTPRPARPRRSDDEQYWSQLISATQQPAITPLKSPKRVANDHTDVLMRPATANTAPKTPQRPSSGSFFSPHIDSSFSPSTGRSAITLQTPPPKRPANPTPNSSPLPAPSLLTPATSKDSCSPIATYRPRVPSYIARIEDIADGLQRTGVEIEQHLKALEEHLREVRMTFREAERWKQQLEDTRALVGNTKIFHRELDHIARGRKRADVVVETDHFPMACSVGGGGGGDVF